MLIDNIQLNIGYLIMQIIAYLLGSFGSGIILFKLIGKGDIRKKGSGNIGATNVYRSGGKLLGLATLLLDVLKGFIAVSIAAFIYPTTTNLHILSGFAVIFGHIYPIWHKFKGGKGVATTVGVFLALDSTLGCITILSWIVVVLVFRYASLASLASILIATIYIVLEKQNTSLAIFAIAVCVLIFTTHWANIKRLRNRTEAKIF